MPQKKGRERGERYPGSERLNSLTSVGGNLLEQIKTAANKKIRREINIIMDLCSRNMRLLFLVSYIDKGEVADVKSYLRVMDFGRHLWRST